MIPDFTITNFISPLENTHSPNDRFPEVNFHQVISPRNRRLEKSSEIHRNLKTVTVSLSIQKIWKDQKMI